MEETRKKAQERRLERLSTAQFYEARIFALRVVRDPAYREALLHHARARRLQPAVEIMLWHYAYGKPPDRIELGHPGEFGDLEGLSREELAARAAAIAVSVLREDDPAAGEAEAIAETDSRVATAARTTVPYIAKQPRTVPTPRQIGALLEAEGALEEESEV